LLTIGAFPESKEVENEDEDDWRGNLYRAKHIQSASLPSPAERLVPIISKVHTSHSALTRKKSLLFSLSLERFFLISLVLAPFTADPFCP
jgi:hypothetical protein